jgi:hypothetical protein
MDVQARALVRDAFAPFGSTALQHIAAILGAHAATKSMHALFAPFAWLIGSLRHKTIISETFVNEVRPV